MALKGLAHTLDLTDRQLRLVLLLTISALVVSAGWLVAAYSDRRQSTPELPVILGDADRQFTGTFVVDPNSSPVDSLELLPGVGPVLAERIVAYRQDHRFKAEVDITEVNGIGPKLYERLRPYLKIKRND